MTVHQRKCFDCGNIAEHTDNIVPAVLCKVCGSQDTRLRLLSERSDHEFDSFAASKNICSVSDVHSVSAAADLMTRPKLIEVVHRLCASHERLRQEFAELDTRYCNAMRRL
jgi:hypothetical protein